MAQGSTGTSRAEGERFQGLVKGHCALCAEAPAHQDPDQRPQAQEGQAARTSVRKEQRETRKCSEDGAPVLGEEREAVTWIRPARWAAGPRQAPAQGY